MTTTSEPTELSEPALSVRQVLTLERVLAGEPEVVAGAGQLDRPVRWVHVAEAPDVGVMLTGGEMVLTTGVLLAGDEDKQAEYIRSLHRAEASAVVLGLGRAFPAPPEVMRRAAERCGLPMVVLHRPFPFAELTEEVQCRLVRRKFAAVSLSESVRTALTALITAGAPLQSLLDEVASHSACPVVVTNLAHRVLATAGERSAVDDVPTGLREAQHVADAADSSAALDLPAVVRLRDVHLRGLIRLLRDDPHVQSFAERELDGLLCAADEDMLSVLRTYLATGRNKSRTAQLHHVSRPALYRRLEAIQTRLGVDLDDFEQAASVHIALLAHDAQQS